MSDIKLGIIGCGIMGERILRVVLNSDDLGVSLAGVFEPSTKRRAEIAEAFPNAQLTESRDELLGNSDCIYIASPPLTHLDHAYAAMKADCAVLTEKPLAVSVEDSEAFAGMAGRPGMRTAVNFIFASSPAAQKVQDWIAEGAVGEPQSVNIEVAFARWPREWQDGAASWLSGSEEGGFLREVVSHFLFLTHRAFGPMTLKSSAIRFDRPGLSEAAVNAELESGGLPVMISGSVGTTDHSDHNIWEVSGTGGKVRLRDWSFAERWNSDSQAWEGDPDALPHEEMRPVILRGQVGKLPALVGGKQTDLATVREALDVQRIVESILSGRH